MSSKTSKKSKKKSSNSTKKKESPSYEEKLKARDRDLIPFFINDPSNPQSLVVNEELQTSRAANKPKQGKTEKMQVREFKDGYFVAMQEYDVHASDRNQKQIDNETFGTDASYHQAMNDEEHSKTSSTELTWQQQLQQKRDNKKLNNNKNNSNNSNSQNKNSSKKNYKRKKNSPENTRQFKKVKDTSPSNIQLNTPLMVEAPISNDRISHNSRDDLISFHPKMNYSNNINNNLNNIQHNNNNTHYYNNNIGRSKSKSKSSSDSNSRIPIENKSLRRSSSKPTPQDTFVAFPTDDVSYLEETVGLLTPADLLDTNGFPPSTHIPPEPVVIPSRTHAVTPTSPLSYQPVSSGFSSKQPERSYSHRDHNHYRPDFMSSQGLNIPSTHEVVHSSDNSGGDSPQSPPQQSALTEADLLASMDIDLNQDKQKKYAGASFSVAPEPSSLPIPDFGSSHETDPLFPSSPNHPSSPFASASSNPSHDNYSTADTTQPTFLQAHDTQNVERMLCSVLNIENK
eukprot:gb/GECH01006684.1/.p1 GENE.gb/GECH01006684.1/~~gb/GECH01006684.1/.p1  ORF type:complete len:512 (+),score=113.15 gb/GECH01006684.1/:1-1536(+)